MRASGCAALPEHGWMRTDWLLARACQLAVGEPWLRALLRAPLRARLRERVPDRLRFVPPPDAPLTLGPLPFARLRHVLRPLARPPPATSPDAHLRLALRRLALRRLPLRSLALSRFAFSRSQCCRRDHGRVLAVIRCIGRSRLVAIRNDGRRFAFPRRRVAICRRRLRRRDVLALAPTHTQCRQQHNQRCTDRSRNAQILLRHPANIRCGSRRARMSWHNRGGGGRASRRRRSARRARPARRRRAADAMLLQLHQHAIFQREQLLQAGDLCRLRCRQRGGRRRRGGGSRWLCAGSRFAR